MNQISIADQLRKTKSGRLKRGQIIPKVKFSEPAQKKEYYLTIHNKIKVEYRNRQYKNVYDKLVKLEKPESSSIPLYLEDFISSINKMLREHIVHKDPKVFLNLKEYLIQGKENIAKLYKLFIFNEQVTNQRKSINEEMQNSITRFLNIIVSFILKYALVCLLKNNKFYAKLLFESLYSICTNILTSSTSNYKILRKIGQGLIVYAVHLIDSQQIDQAISVLFECLKNEMNLVIILSYRLKQKSRSQAKQRKLDLFNRLYAIFFNLTHCFQLKHKLHWCYLCLRECQIISQLKIKLLEKDIKINWADILKNYKVLYDEYIQIKKIVEIYFDANQLRQQFKISKKYQQNSANINEQTHKDVISLNSFQKSNKIDVEKKNKRSLRRSVSLQQNIENENNKRYYKDFGQQLLFYGINLFQKPANKPKKIHTSVFKLKSTAIVSHHQTPNDPLREHPLNTKSNLKLDSKLKKKYKKVENNLFRRVQQPMEYDKLQEKFKNMWAEQERVNNRAKQKKYLLKYKSQYINYKQIAEQNKSIYQEIQVVKSKNQFTFKEKKKVHEVEEEQKDKGIDLFKKIILKHSKQLDIKKSETFNVLKKKRSFKCQYDSYTSPDISVNFLLEKVKKEKERLQENKTKIKQDEIQTIQKQRFKGQNVFLTKDTVQIPNLFLSYITSSGFSCQAPSIILEYSHRFSKPN